MQHTVLIVEDNDLNMRLFKDVLTLAGFRILEAGDGAFALRQATDERPDLIVLDIQIPGLNGLEVVRRLKKDAVLRRIPVLVVSAYAQAADRGRARANGSDGYLAKPFSPKALIASVEALLPTREPQTTGG